MRGRIIENIKFDLAYCDVFVACLFREKIEKVILRSGFEKQFFVLCFIYLFPLEIIRSQNIAVSSRPPFRCIQSVVQSLVKVQRMCFPEQKFEQTLLYACIF